MSILLIRHGETALNVARVLQPADTPLSARGVAQAEALARRLAGLHVVHIVSSDLPRALATAQAIAAATGAPRSTTPLLHERNFGDWRGQPYDVMSIDPLTLQAAPPGGESAADFQARVAQAWAHVVALAQTQTQAQAQTQAVGPTSARVDAPAPSAPVASPAALVVVTHGLVLGAMLTRHARLPDASPPPTHLRNTGLSIVEAHPPHAARLVDCTQHLDDQTLDDARALSGG